MDVEDTLRVAETETEGGMSRRSLAAEPSILLDTVSVSVTQDVSSTSIARPKKRFRVAGRCSKERNDPPDKPGAFGCPN